MNRSILIVMAVMAALALALPAAATTPPNKQVAALSAKVKTLTAKLADAQAMIGTVSARNDALQGQVGGLTQQLEAANAKLATQPSPVSAIQAMSVKDAMHNVFPSLVSWFNQYTGGLYGSASTYQNGTWLSFTFTCYGCG